MKRKKKKVVKRKGRIVVKKAVPLASRVLTKLRGAHAKAEQVFSETSEALDAFDKVAAVLEKN